MSTDKYAVPDYAVSRVRYYTGQFLREDDFIAEETYHIAHQRRHERLLHVAGVTEGLEVTLVSGGAAVEVAPGSALDTAGRHILLAQKQTITLDPTMTGVAYVEVAFSEAESHPADQNSTVQANTRFSQSATPAAIVRTKTPGAVTLAMLTVTAGTPVLSFAERAYSGVRLPGPANASGGGALRSRGDANPGWAELGCSLSVTGNALVSGNASVTGTLGVTGAVAAQSHLTVGGNAGVTGTLNVTGAVTASSNATVGGTLGVTGAVTLSNNLSVTGNQTLTGGLTVSGTANLNGNAAVGGTLGVTGVVTLSNNLSVNGNQSLAGTLTVSGAATANNGLTVSAGGLTVSTLAPNQAVFTNASKQLATGTLTVPMGGTGATSLTGVVRGNGAGAMTAMTGTAGQMVRWTDANTIAASSLITESGGLLGIGTASPQAPVHLFGGNSTLRLEANSPNGWAEIDLYSNYSVPDQKNWNIAAQGGGGFAIRQLTDSRGWRNTPFFIDTAGNVGIGTGTGQPRGRLDLGYGGLNANLRIGDYIDIGETALNNMAYLGLNAVLSTSSSANRFRPVNAPGTGMLQVAYGAGGDVEWFGINWNGDAGEKDFPAAFTHVMHLGADGKVGVGTTAPRTALDVGSGLLSGAPNDYMKAQFSLSGGGKVTWNANRLKWTNRFIAIAVEKWRTFANGFVDVYMPAVGTAIPASDGTTRTVDSNGIYLNAWDALYAVHTVGGGNVAVQLRIQYYSHDFHAPSNWILVAVANGDDSTVKLGTGAILSSNSSLTKGSQVPSGTIVMWFGDASTVPDGWAICNGGNGTPNLTDRFIVGAGASYGFQATGGEAMHTLTVNEMPSHAHTALGGGYDDRNFSGGNLYNGERIPWTRSDANDATLETTRNTGGGLPHENRPPYFALFFIMKL